MSEFENTIIQKINEIIKITSSSSWIQNLISTLAGVMFGFFLTIISNRIGRLKYYIVSSSVEYLGKSPRGSLIKTDFNENVQTCKIEIVIDFHNTSQNNIGIRNIEIIVEEKNVRKKLEVYDLETRRVEKVFIVSDTVEILNVEPHGVLRKKLSAFVDYETIKIFKEKPEIYLSYIAKNNKKLIKIKE